jgi:hypothetical protein
MTVPLLVVLQSDTSGLKQGLDEGGKGFEIFGQKVSTGALVAGAAVAAGALVAVDAIAGWTQAAIDDAAEHERLMTTIQNAGAATGEYTAQVDAAIAAGQKRAFTDSEVREGLGALVAATGDVTTASELLATSQDVARASGVDLQTAVDAVRKAYDGNGKSLAALTDQQAAGRTGTEILSEAQRLAAGQADKYGASTKGAMDASRIAMDEATETIGAAFIPIVEAIIPALVPVLEAIGELVTALLPVLKPLIGGVAQAFRIMGEAVKVVVTIVTGLIGAIQDVIGWFEDLIAMAQGALDTVGGAIDAINPFALPAPVAGPAALGIGARAAGASSGGGGVTVNVYGGDPRRVERAVRDGYRHWRETNGDDAPSRDW